VRVTIVLESSVVGDMAWESKCSKGAPTVLPCDLRNVFEKQSGDFRTGNPWKPGSSRIVNKDVLELLVLDM
jgi:hypothetical protein